MVSHGTPLLSAGRGDDGRAVRLVIVVAMLVRRHLVTSCGVVRIDIVSKKMAIARRRMGR